MGIQVPKVKFEEMRSRICCAEIAQGYIPKTVFYGGTEYVVTGSGRGGVFVYRVVDLGRYIGTLKPLEYGRHFLAVDLGERARCYNGLLTKMNRRKLVIIGEEILFTESPEGTQTSLF